MLSGRGLCNELITRPEESYRLCCVVVCDLETSKIGAPYIYDISNLRVKSQLLSRKTRIHIYKTLVRPIFTYTTETWTMTKNDERRLSIFERKVLHRIYGPICERGQWQKRYNRELEELYNESNIVNVIKSSRLRWAGHVVRMDEDELPKKILWTNPGGQRGHGQPKSRRTDGVEEDARKLGCRNWLAAVQNRGCWRHLLEGAKAHPGL